MERGEKPVSPQIQISQNKEMKVHSCQTIVVYKWVLCCDSGEK